MKHTVFPAGIPAVLPETHYGITITNTSLKPKAVSGPGNVAKYLDIGDNTPLLHSTGLPYGKCHGEEVPIEFFTSYYLTTRFEIYAGTKTGVAFMQFIHIKGDV